MSIRFLAAAFLLASSGMLALGETITYNLNTVYGSSSAVGTITTDGNIGTLATSDILSWDVTLTRDGNAIRITPSTGRTSVEGTNLSATSTDLFYDFDQSGFSWFLFQDNDSGSYLCYQGPDGDCDGKRDTGTGSIGISNFQVPGDPDYLLMTGNAAITGDVPLAATPEPSSLALLGTGLLGVYGAARRRFA